MTNRKALLYAGVAAIGLLATLPAAAQTATELQAENQSLRQQIDELRRRLGDQPAAAPSPIALAATGAGAVVETAAPAADAAPADGDDIVVSARNRQELAQDVPLPVLAQNHGRLSLKCMIQSYPERSSFFFFLERTYGKEALHNFAYQLQPVSNDSYPAAFGRSLDDLAKAWRADAEAQYKSLPNAAADTAAYWANTPAAYFPSCKAGVDY